MFASVPNWRWLPLGVAAALLSLMPAPALADDVACEAPEATLYAKVEDDWAAQEKRKGRTTDDPRAVRDVLAAAERLFDALSERSDTPDLGAEAQSIERLSRKV